ncbi:hypothetical protein ON010_g16845 [Phytophthora cinnamomi]|nr:hypothetical protein ON010_g16845 [Phytophthora cinnamomi]
MVDMASVESLLRPQKQQQDAAYPSSVAMNQLKPLYSQRRGHSGHVGSIKKEDCKSQHPPGQCGDAGSDNTAGAEINSRTVLIDRKPAPWRLSSGVRHHLNQRLSASIAPPENVPQRNNERQWQLNYEKQRVVTAMAIDHGMSLPNIVEIVRGQSTQDPRPNKAMHPSRLNKLLDGYKHKAFPVTIALEGIQPLWRAGAPHRTRLLKNHGSA